MLLTEKNITIPVSNNEQSLISYFESFINNILSDDEIPVRFVVTGSDKYNYHCEIGVLSGVKEIPDLEHGSIFKFKKRKLENTNQFNTVFIVPTGIGAPVRRSLQLRRFILTSCTSAHTNLTKPNPPILVCLKNLSHFLDINPTIL